MPEIKQKVEVFLEDAFTPVNDANIQLIPLGIKDAKNPEDELQEQISKNGEVIFTCPSNAKQFKFEISDERFYKIAKNDIVRTIRSCNENKSIKLILLSKFSFYFNGKELQIHQNNKIAEYYRAYSGKALNTKDKEALEKDHNYKNFVSYEDEKNNISYFCLDEGWQKEKDKGAIPEGKYYIDISQNEKNKTIYTDENCTNTTESTTGRKGFHLRGDKYGKAGGINLAKENDKLASRLGSFPKSKDKKDKIVVELLVEYTHTLSNADLQSIDLQREIQKADNTNTTNTHTTDDNTNKITKHRVVLTANYTSQIL